MTYQWLVGLGIALILVGFILAFLALIAVAIRGAKGRGEVSGGGVVLIGPIPIIFGTDKDSVKILVILAIVLTVVLLAFMLIGNVL